MKADRIIRKSWHRCTLTLSELHHVFILADLFRSSPVRKYSLSLLYEATQGKIQMNNRIKNRMIQYGLMIETYGKTAKGRITSKGFEFNQLRVMKLESDLKSINCFGFKNFEMRTMYVAEVLLKYQRNISGFGIKKNVEAIYGRYVTDTIAKEHIQCLKEANFIRISRLDSEWEICTYEVLKEEIQRTMGVWNSVNQMLEDWKMPEPRERASLVNFIKID